jgi:hypothetical protein
MSFSTIMVLRIPQIRLLDMSKYLQKVVERKGLKH